MRERYFDPGHNDGAEGKLCAEDEGMYLAVAHLYAEAGIEISEKIIVSCSLFTLFRQTMYCLSKGTYDQKARSCAADEASGDYKILLAGPSSTHLALSPDYIAWKRVLLQVSAQW